eukprot:maker-scaffold_2-snap-gene-16.35-mRNA-1 protein AED:0.10 eAED:0.10 QI:0/0/0/0.66/1/1/3/0/1201
MKNFNNAFDIFFTSKDSRFDTPLEKVKTINQQESVIDTSFAAISAHNKKTYPILQPDPVFLVQDEIYPNFIWKNYAESFQNISKELNFDEYRKKEIEMKQKSAGLRWLEVTEQQVEVNPGGLLTDMQAIKKTTEDLASLYFPSSFPNTKEAYEKMEAKERKQVKDIVERVDRLLDGALREDLGYIINNEVRFENSTLQKNDSGEEEDDDDDEDEWDLGFDDEDSGSEAETENEKKIGITVETDESSNLKDEEMKEESARIENFGEESKLDPGLFNAEIANPARSFNFELDKFQKQAIMHLERGDHVFVSAHTSAGKTVVAEYAIGMSIRRNTRIIYTSPIKALSNQKFRDFKTTFSTPEKQNVGLVTGDVSLNQDACCLVMTTEILRSMLYKGAEIVRDIEFVVFDEVHYINDIDRGVVWEEVILLLPSYVKLIFLSATTPNTLEFSNWIGRTKQRMVYVVKTDYRPVPLKHYVFKKSTSLKVVKGKNVQSTKYLHAVKDGNGFHLQALKKLCGPTKKEMKKEKKPVKKKFSSQPDIVSLVRDVLQKDEMLPCVLFTFSKKQCDAKAEQVFKCKSIDLASKNEKAKIIRIFNKSIARLSEVDRNIPQILAIAKLVEKGIGVHHSGLLPILKEVVEILFSTGLVKVLFATETFAIGVNMPAKCVVFNGLRKHDGVQFRNLLPGEYTQMSGRAGRRGKDEVGHVILFFNLDPKGSKFDKFALSPDDVKKMLTGKPIKLESKFRLSYNLILKLFRSSNNLGVSEMIKMSFSEFKTQKQIGAENVLSEIARMERENRKKLRELDDEKFLLHRDNNIPLEKSTKMIELLWKCKSSAIVFSSEFLNVIKPKSSLVLVDFVRDNQFVKVCLVKAKLRGGDLLVYNGKRNVPISFLNVLGIVKRKGSSSDYISEFKVVPVKKEQTKKNFRKISVETFTAFKTYESEFTTLCTLLEEVHQEKKLGLTEVLTSLWRRYSEIQQTENQLVERRKILSDENLKLYPDYQARVALLKEYQFISDVDDTVLLKGRIAPEISTCDEFLMTEVLFRNYLNDVTPVQAAALLSGFIMKRKSNQEEIDESDARLALLGDEGLFLLRTRDKILSLGQELYEKQLEYKIELQDNWLENSLGFQLLEVVYHWGKGKNFTDISKMTDMDAGLIVRVISRLNDTIGEVKLASQVMGDSDLYKKMEEASLAIKRDIIFANSLYLV